MGDKGLPSSFDSNTEFFEENRWQKFTRRLKQEPLIPLGCAATCFALWGAYKSMKARDSVQLNKMFRARIYAQGFTVACVVLGGVYYKEERARRRELERALDERKSQAKRDAWLKELEVRDQEDRDWRERHTAVQQAAAKPGLRDVEFKGANADSKSDARNTGGANSSLETAEEKDNPKRTGGVLQEVKNLLSSGK